MLWLLTESDCVIELDELRLSELELVDSDDVELEDEDDSEEVDDSELELDEKLEPQLLDVDSDDVLLLALVAELAELSLVSSAAKMQGLTELPDTKLTISSLVANRRIEGVPALPPAVSVKINSHSMSS